MLCVDFNLMKGNYEKLEKMMEKWRVRWWRHGFWSRGIKELQARCLTSFNFSSITLQPVYQYLFYTVMRIRLDYTSKMFDIVPNQIRSDQSLSRVRLFAAPWIAACQASLSITNS